MGPGKVRYIEKGGRQHCFGTEKSDEDKEEVKGAVLGGGGDDFSVMTFF